MSLMIPPQYKTELAQATGISSQELDRILTTWNADKTVTKEDFSSVEQAFLALKTIYDKNPNDYQLQTVHNMAFQVLFNMNSSQENLTNVDLLALQSFTKKPKNQFFYDEKEKKWYEQPNHSHIMREFSDFVAQEQFPYRGIELSKSQSHLHPLTRKKNICDRICLKKNKEWVEFEKSGGKSWTASWNNLLQNLGLKNVPNEEELEKMKTLATQYLLDVCIAWKYESSFFYMKKEEIENLGIDPEYASNVHVIELFYKEIIDPMQLAELNQQLSKGDIL